jgi:putative membrane protein
MPRPYIGRLVRRVERLPVWASLVLWAAAIGTWHVPALYDEALANGTVHDLEHATFVAVGLLVWMQLLDPARRRRLFRRRALPGEPGS